MREPLMNFQGFVGRYANTFELKIKTTNNTGPSDPTLQIHTGDAKCQGPSGGDENKVGQRCHTIVDLVQHKSELHGSTYMRNFFSKYMVYHKCIFCSLWSS